MLFLLDRKERMVAVLNNKVPLSCPYYDDMHTENIETGLNTYEFTIPANHETAEKVESEGYVIFSDLDGKLQMFQIKDIDEVATDDTYEKTIFCEHTAIPELLGNPLRPFSLASSTMKNSLEYILQGTGWNIGEIEFTESRDFFIDEYTNCLEGLYSLLELYDAEVQFEVVFIGGVVKDKLIHVTKQRGRRTMKRFTYTKDLKDVKRKENSEGVVTALIGVGRGDTSGNRLTLTGFASSLPDGFEEYKEADWIGNEEALQRFGKNGKHIFGVFMDDNAPNQEVLHANTLKELMIRSKPKLTYEMSVVTLEHISGYEADKVRVGDTIVGDDYSFKPRLVVEARVVELKRSYTNPDSDSLVLGDYRPIKIASNSTVEKIQKLISKAEEKWNTSTFKVEILSSNGLMFRSGDIVTTLEARVFQGAEDITDIVDSNSFKWKRVSSNPTTDKLWNDENAGGRKVIHITNEDVVQRATFTCEVNI